MKTIGDWQEVNKETSKHYAYYSPSQPVKVLALIDETWWSHLAIPEMEIVPKSCLDPMKYSHWQHLPLTPKKAAK